MSDIKGVDFAKDQALIDGLKVHLYTTLNRLKYGLAISNLMLNEIKNMYPYMFDMIITVLNDTIFPFDLPEIEGEGTLCHNDREYVVKKGDHFLLSAGFGSFTLNGEIELIVSHV